MGKINSLLVALSLSLLCGCVSIFMPGKQKVTINTHNPKAKVFINNEEAGEGETVVTKVTRSKVQQVVVQAPGYKDTYYTLLQCRRANGFWPMIALDLPFFYISLPLDVAMSKGYAFNRYNEMPPLHENVNRKEAQKYIELEAIKINIKDKNKDILTYNLSYNKDMDAALVKCEKEKTESLKKQELKASKKKTKKKNVLDEDEDAMKSENSDFSELIYKTLKKSGFADTTRNILAGNNNRIQLEGSINRIHLYNITGKPYYSYNKSKLEITWRIKNQFGEIMDSIKTEAYSGDFYIEKYNDKESKTIEKMFADATNEAYMTLINNKDFTKYLEPDNSYKINDPMLAIKQSKHHIKDVSEATEASVIIKRKDGGHGSGFAISEDGYILTNYHVIASKELGKFDEIKIITSSGEEIKANVERYNRIRDLALLKVDSKFEKTFALTNERNFKNLQEVYTIGAPKSVELGQSVSIGLISNERKSNNVDLLQLSMSVNPGNSGGPLFDKSGNLHGVISSKLVGFATEGVSFAIPSYLIADYLNLTL